MVSAHRDAARADGPLVTVYIATKDRLDLLRRAVASVRAQTYRNLELVVVDDGSADGTREYLLAEQEAGALTALFNERSLGACAARNRAILAGTGQFVAGLDDDDRFLPQRIRTFVEKWPAQAGLAGLYDSARVLTASGELEQARVGRVSYEMLRRDNVIGNSVFAPKSHYVEAGLFDPEMPAWQDWDLWLRMAGRFGAFEGTGTVGQVIDESRENERITLVDGARIREAMHRLRGKLGRLSPRGRAALVRALHKYPQVRPTGGDFLQAALGLAPRTVFRMVRKSVFRGGRG